MIIITLHQLFSNTYVSALVYSHKLSGLPDPTKVIFIIQMLGSRLDKRLPITLPILHRIIDSAVHFATHIMMFAYSEPCAHLLFCLHEDC